MSDLETRVIEFVVAGNTAPVGELLTDWAGSVRRGLDLVVPQEEGSSPRIAAIRLAERLCGHMAAHAGKGPPVDAWVPTVASCLATAVDGHDVAEPIAIGLEAGSHILESLGGDDPANCWDTTAMAGGISAVLALSRMIGLSKEQVGVALALATVQSPQYRPVVSSRLRSLLVGKTTAQGVDAVFVARAGLTAAQDTITGPRGLLAVLGTGATPGHGSGIGDPWRSRDLLEHALMLVEPSWSKPDRVSP